MKNIMSKQAYERGVLEQKKPLQNPTDGLNSDVTWITTLHREKENLPNIRESSNGRQRSWHLVWPGF